MKLKDILLHDKLCPTVLSGGTCLCKAIAFIRADERYGAGQRVIKVQGIWRDPNAAWETACAARNEQI